MRPTDGSRPSRAVQHPELISGASSLPALPSDGRAALLRRRCRPGRCIRFLPPEPAGYSMPGAPSVYANRRSSAYLPSPTSCAIPLAWLRPVSACMVQSAPRDRDLDTVSPASRHPSPPLARPHIPECRPAIGEPQSTRARPPWRSQRRLCRALLYLRPTITNPPVRTDRAGISSSTVSHTPPSRSRPPIPVVLFPPRRVGLCLPVTRAPAARPRLDRVTRC